MLVLSIRTNVREAAIVLEELNQGNREQTYPRTLERCFRTIEHDARALGLEKLARFAQLAKEASPRVLDPSEGTAVVELITEAGGELIRVSDDVENQRPHPLDERLVKALEAAVASRPPSQRPIKPS